MSNSAEPLVGGMKLYLSTRKGVASRLVALNGNLTGRIQEMCPECPVANGKVDGATCHRISPMDGVALLHLLDVAVVGRFLGQAACKIDQVNGVDLQVANRLNQPELNKTRGVIAL